MPRRFLGALLLGLAFTGLAFQVRAESVEELNERIKEKQSQAEQLKQDIETYQSAIAQKQLQSASLKNQLAVLDDKIAQAELELEQNQLKLDTVTLQIQSVTLAIQGKEEEVAEHRGQVGEVLRLIHRADQRTMLEVLVLNSSLSEFFTQLNYLDTLQQTLQDRINSLQLVKTELEHQQQDLASYKTQLVKTREELEKSQARLEDEQETKQTILKQTRQSENRFQSLLFQAQQEQKTAIAEAQALEREVRRRLQQEESERFSQLGDANFIWPVTPTRGISTYFYDPTYIFRRYFEHPGIDIPRPQGSDVKAAADGYVARAKDAGLGYSYIMLIHADGFSTVYGHVSRIDAEEGQYVGRGQVIAGVGGLPGTRGAGQLTTGPHLHFELRSNGLPVNPLDYLP